MNILSSYLHKNYNFWELLKGGIGHNLKWGKAFINCAQPKASYDALIIGGGGHGLATAYYLAKEYGIYNIAILEKGTIGQGNVGRNTTTIRSNYELSENSLFYEAGLKMWEGLSQVLNYNVMFSQRGVTNIAHNDAEMDDFRRRGNAMRLLDIDAEMLTPAQLQKIYPQLNYDAKARFPIHGGLHQKRAGTARHDAIVWGYARAANQLGVDIIQNCAVTGFMIENGIVKGVETTQGRIKSPKIGVAVAGHSSEVMAQAGVQNLPIESHLLQACVSESLKPFLNGVISFGGGGLFYITQSDKGGLVFGGNLDGYASYAAKGNLPAICKIAECAKAIIPALSRVRLLRHWGGVMDMSMDGSPIISKTPIEGLYFNGGWCYGGFKATPISGLCFAHLMAQDQSHPLAEPFNLGRFSKGYILDEQGSGATPNLH